MKGLIVAAGQGVRLREKGDLKPLVLLKGDSIIEHVIMRARRAGITEFVVVVGYRSDDLRAELDLISVRQQVQVTHVLNTQWKRANGVSLLAAKSCLDGDFLLMMCDHLVDPEIYCGLMSTIVEPDTVTLAVDYNLSNPLNDPEDVTRVSCEDGRIRQIGKTLKNFNAIDTGTFLCSPIVFEALEASQAQGDDSISGAMNVLARWDKARVFDVGSKLWIDIDDPAAFRNVEYLLESGQL